MQGGGASPRTDEVAHRRAVPRRHVVAVARVHVLRGSAEHAAEGDGEHLQAAAHPEQGHAPASGGSGEGDLRVVACAVDVARRGRVGTGQLGVDIATTGEHQAVEQIQEGQRPGSRQQHGVRPHGHEPVDVRRRGPGHGQRTEWSLHDVLVPDDSHQWSRRSVPHAQSAAIAVTPSAAPAG